jgi:spermidine/putrescine transport system permease protein
MKSDNLLMKIFLGLYLVVFFGYLLGPLIIMSITGFNSPGFPRAAPWECLTFEWFEVLANDKRILNGITNSAIVGAGTVILSVVMGLAGALVLTQIWPKLRATYYTIVIAPILIPGVVLGISTLVFWDRINVMLGFSNESFLHNGLFLTILGQSTFIASYCMLVFVARLQRFDIGLTEAALDLGATNVQAFRKIMLPFLKPAIGSAAVLAFLASFENYNTTTFTFGKFPTLTIELAQKVRYGINPSISVLAFIIVVLTIVGALSHEIYQRRKQLALANGAPVGAVGGGFKLPGFLRNNPAAIVMMVLAVGGFSTIWFANVYSPESCKIEVRDQKRILQQQRIDEIQQQRLKQKQKKAQQGPDIFSPDKSLVPQNVPTPQSPGKGSFGSVFDPQNLDKAGPESKAAPSTSNPGAGAFGGVFDTQNLKKQTESGD